MVKERVVVRSSNRNRYSYRRRYLALSCLEAKQVNTCLFYATVALTRATIARALNDDTQKCYFEGLCRNLVGIYLSNVITVERVIEKNTRHRTIESFSANVCWIFFRHQKADLFQIN